MVTETSRLRPRNVLLLGTCLFAVPTQATVVVYGSNDSLRRFADVPSTKGFGPRIPKEGFGGYLQLAKPDIFACSEMEPPTLPNDQSAEINRHLRGNSLEKDLLPMESGASDIAMETIDDASATGIENGMPAAVLVSRSLPSDPDRCTFEKKVLNAQAAGYKLVIVFDYKQEGPFKMGSATDDDDPHPPVEIPLVLVTQKSGLALQKLVEESPDTHGPEIEVDNTDPYVNVFVTINFTMLMVVLGFLMALLTCGSMMVLTLHRYMRRYEDLLVGSPPRLMPLPEVLQLPEVLVEEESKLVGESCPVCLETYQAGDKLRGLPCQHVFHAGCITPWLTQGQRTCPMCKDPVELQSSSNSGGGGSSSSNGRGGPSTADHTANGADTNNAVRSASTRSPRQATSFFSAHFVVGSGGLGVAYSSLSSGVEDGRDQEDAGGTSTSPGRGGVEGVGRVTGDRLPLLLNSRGARSNGGSMQSSSPV